MYIYETNAPFQLICYFTRVNSHPIVVQIHKVIPGTVALSQSVQKAVNMKSTIHSHHVCSSSHTHPHVIAYESNSRFMEWDIGHTCGLWLPLCMCTTPYSNTPFKTNKQWISAGVELQRVTQQYRSSNEYTKISVKHTHTVCVCVKGSYKFYPPTWIWRM